MRSPPPSGIDIAKGLTIFEHDEDLYLKVLKSIAEYHDRDMERLLGELADGNDLGAAAIAHNLKGMAGNVGAVELFRVAGEAEESLRAKAADRFRKCKALETEMKSLVASLTSYFSMAPFPNPPERPAGPGGKDELSDILLRLAVPLNERKPKQCMEIGEELARYSWPEAWREEIGRLSVCVTRYRFAESLSIIEKLKEVLRCGESSAHTDNDG